MNSAFRKQKKSISSLFKRFDDSPHEEQCWRSAVHMCHRYLGNGSTERTLSIAAVNYVWCSKASQTAHVWLGRLTRVPCGRRRFLSGQIPRSRVDLERSPLAEEHAYLSAGLPLSPLSGIRLKFRRSPAFEVKRLPLSLSPLISRSE